MNEVRCPMCGKANPADLEVCQFCQARLKPLAPVSSQPETLESSAERDLRSDNQPAPDETLPDWLRDLRPEETASEALPLEEPQSEDLPQDQADLLSDPLDSEAAEEQLPDWLSALPSEEKPASLPGTPGPEEAILPVAQAGPEGESQPSLEPAELPVWVAAMQPEANERPTKPAPEKTELAGPLAGLSGTLSAEPDAARVRSQATRPVKLRVTANQRVHADLLQNLLATEKEPPPIPRRPAISSQHVLRWMIALILMLSVLWPLLMGNQQASLPGYTEEAAEVNRLINQLPASARVLLAFEYDPGLSAEMDAVAAPVLDHLMLRGAYFSVVSTSPIGPILAERFLKNIMAPHNYRSGIQYVNLGFIPGGPAGLSSFIGNPQRALPETLDGLAAWESPAHPALPPLQDVQDILDFSMILAIVDNPETARMWVEQIQPKLSAAQSLTPLVMVTSAQIEPLVQPYYESDPRQVDGYVAGLRGGAAYARLTGRGGLPRFYWDAFGVGVFVAAILLIVGGVFNIYSVALPRSPQKESEAKG